MNHQVKSISIPDLSLRIQASRGASSYWIYLVEVKNASDVIHELIAECRAFDESVVIEAIESSSANDLLDKFRPLSEVIIIDATRFSRSEWRNLDLRRSDLSHDGVVVFVTTTSCFDDLMNVAPNLASWLGGLVSFHDDGTARTEEVREQRLQALRRWSKKTDEDIIRAAEKKALPLDPEYGEWLALLGRGDLLDA